MQSISSVEHGQLSRYLSRNLGPELWVTIKCPECDGKSLIFRIFTDPKDYQEEVAKVGELESLRFHLAHRLHEMVELIGSCNDCKKILEATLYLSY